MLVKKLIPLFIIAFCSCNLKNNKSEIQFPKIRKIFSDGTPDATYGNIYVHYILISDLSFESIDSINVINRVMNYVDTVSTDTPIEVLKVFNSDKHFIPNETSQVMEEINKDCIATIGFDLKNRKPIDFVFYNKEGEICYWGNLWKPCRNSKK